MRGTLAIALYIIAGIGIAAGVEGRLGRKLSGTEQYYAVLLWPGVVTAKAYTMWTEPKSSCSNALGGQM
ncbi:hypothetical protein HRR99_03060 [Agrobacterium vaccinii]|uniref:hypothetical protein n=1 Tax=Agrobacterium vaccinii TaxID=2735528 RepID=UPI001E47DE32|nr:hypothetical protein [Agrobacterium vaccinii]UHS60571.1 hypothetical protein HRR99_03060 [Agrobacterium vaccinii]